MLGILIPRILVNNRRRIARRLPGCVSQHPASHVFLHRRDDVDPLGVAVVAPYRVAVDRFEHVEVVAVVDACELADHQEDVAVHPGHVALPEREIVLLLLCGGVVASAAVFDAFGV